MTAAGRLAAHLRGYGAGPDVVTGIALPHGRDLITAVLGIWLAGGAYAVLDTAGPPARLGQQITAAGVSIVVTDAGQAGALPARTIPVMLADATGPGAAAPEGTGQGSTVRPPASWPAGRLAYVVFTSGTTGAAKPVGVSHASLAHYRQAIARRLEPSAGKTWSLVTPLSVDLGLTTVLLALTSGGRLDLADPRSFAAALAAGPPDCLKITPTHLRLLLSDPAWSRGLPRELLIMGGEPATPALLGALAA